MVERHFAWDEVSEGLMLVSVTKTKDEQAKGRKKQAIVTQASDFYCPHAYLILNYQETLNDSEKIKFRKRYLRKVPPSEPDVIILQDIKDLVLFLLVTPVSSQFINFLHLAIVDRFLRALIIYFQRFVEIWESLMEERAATMKKAPNPLARGHRSRYAEEMRVLRCILGREYADLVLGCQDGPQYHHLMTTKKRSTVTQSQGEKDLRIFEALISVAHRVIWIALQRKHFNLIELELHRLFRTDLYNTAQRQTGGQIIQQMLENDIRILHGPMLALKGKLSRNSPLLHELIYMDCDYRLLSFEVVDLLVDDPKVIYLKNALLVDEEILPQLGIKVGILGHNRSDYDIMLMPNEEQIQTDITEISPFDGKRVERESITMDEIPEKIREHKRLTTRKYEIELVEEFPVKEIKITDGRYAKVRKEARKKWILREIQRLTHKTLDTFSLATTPD